MRTNVGSNAKKKSNNCSGRISAHLSKYYERLTKHHLKRIFCITGKFW